MLGEYRNNIIIYAEKNGFIDPDVVLAILDQIESDVNIILDFVYDIEKSHKIDEVKVKLESLSNKLC